MASITLPYTQESFSGGMNLLNLDTQIATNQYLLLFNGRTRFGDVRPVKTPIDITEGLPAVTSKTQGLYAFGNILVCFLNGVAYYKLEGGPWTQVVGFAMSSTADHIYVCAVPSSTLNYARKNSEGTLPQAGVTLESDASTPSPVALVCQDGVNQPFIILPDGSCRVTKTYDQWTTADREYVPVGRQMVYFNGILFVVAPDSKSIYRSVSGRPLDFVIAINDSDGDKISDATPLSFAVDANEIKLITQLNTNSLIIITAYTAYAVKPDYDNTLFDEPRFTQTLLFSAGVVNQFSFTDILGDFAFIDREGVKSFNAVSQLTFEGNNSVFSLNVARMFRNIIQTDPCVGSFDNYTFFGVKTVYSDNAILVYDNILKVFVAVDTILPAVIKQFASTYTASEQKFYALTTDKVYELYSADSPSYKEAILYTRSFDSRNNDINPTATQAEIQSEFIKAIFEDPGSVEARLQITELLNGRAMTPVNNALIQPLGDSGIAIPVTIPVMFGLTNDLNNITIPTRGKRGTKLSYVVVWEGGSRLTRFQLLVQSSQPVISTQQKALVYA